MKLMDISQINAINTYINDVDFGESRFFGRVEAYTCKMARNDRRTVENLERAIIGSHTDDSPFGPLHEKVCRQALIYLITTLNCAFPYYDFSTARPTEFRRLPSYHEVLRTVGPILSSTKLGLSPSVKASFWDVLDAVIQLEECQIYTYDPEVDANPLYDDDDCLWSYNYLLYNRRLKRVLFLVFYAKYKTLHETLPPFSDDDDSDDSAGTEYDATPTHPFDEFDQDESDDNDDDDDDDEMTTPGLLGEDSYAVL